MQQQQPLKSSQIGPVNEIPSSAVFIDGRWFKDSQGRTLQLRGVNLSGNVKLPTLPAVASTTHGRPSFDSDDNLKASWYDHREVSFVGRPFPLEEAHEHLHRLQQWGFTLIRFCITWEALEHAGPGKFDKDYASYVVQVLQLVKIYAPLRVFIDPHQDCWSRFTGGSGSPGWTLELVGFDLKVLCDYTVGCAIVQNTYQLGEDAQSLLDYPKMIWPTNYYKLGCLVMFTMFFAGNHYFPKCQVLLSEDPSVEDKMLILSDDQLSLHSKGKPCPYSVERFVSIQDYLQSHYMDSIAFLIDTIKEKDSSLLDTVIMGYDTLNEPSPGLIGYETLLKFSKHHDLKIGGCPTALQGMLLGQGQQIEAENWQFGALGPQKKGYVTLNSKRLRVWREGYFCPFEAHNIYTLNGEGEVTVHRDSYFQDYQGRPVDFGNDFWLPFARKYTTVIRQHHANAIIFAEPAVLEVPPNWLPGPTDRIVYTPHWYDGVTLMNKSFSKWWNVDFVGYKRNKYLTILGALHFGLNGVRSCFRKQLGTIKQEGLDYMGEIPCIIGEIGIPFDMDGKAAYKSQAALRLQQTCASSTSSHSRQSTVRRLINYIAPSLSESSDPYSMQKLALDANISALESLLLNYTLWNYCADNNHVWGDQWNNEDLSLWSKDDVFRAPTAIKSGSGRSRGSQKSAGAILDSLAVRKSKLTESSVSSDSSTKGDSPSLTESLASSETELSLVATHKRANTSPLRHAIDQPAQEGKQHPSVDLNLGARALGAFCRPYPIATCGTPLAFTFNYDSKDKQFLFTFQDQSNKFGSNGAMIAGQGTEIYVPLFHYGLPLDRELFYLNDITKGSDGYFPYSADEQGCLDYDENQVFFDVQVSDGSWTYCASTQVLHYFHNKPLGIYGKQEPGVHQIALSVVSKKELRRRLGAALVKANRNDARCTVQ